MGVFSNKSLKKGQNLFVTHFIESQNDWWTNVSPNYLYNHSSSNPNCESITKGTVKYLIALRDISEGEEILADYTKDSDVEQPQSGWK